jgi:restriction system protein
LIELLLVMVIPYVFKAYKVDASGKDVTLMYTEGNEKATDVDINSDLDSIIKYYKQAASKKIQNIDSPVRQGLFYMEKQLEDFLIHNWVNTELGSRLDLIVEDGELVSQQYPTDIGPIDILAKDKKTGGHVVIELKRSQTSDDTIGQLARYMGWVTANMKDVNVRGIIVAGAYDKRLAYALKMIPNIEVYLYDISFKLKGFSPE